MALKNRIPIFLRQLNDAIDRGIDTSADLMVDLEQQLCPVRTGAMRDTIRKEGEAGSLKRQVIVGNDDVNYPHWVEFGTHDSPAQPFVMPTVRAIQPAIEVAKEIRALVRITMNASPILDAEVVIASTLVALLAPASGVYDGRPKVYWLEAAQGAPLPYLVAQLQAPTTPARRVGDTGAEAFITIRAVASNAKAARDLLVAAVALLPATSTTAGYTLTFSYTSSPPTPPKDGVYQSAHIFTIHIERL